MNWPVLTEAQSAVQLMMGVGCLLTGLSHIVQPRMWQDYFATLHEQGNAGVLVRTMTWELWPALIVVTLHQVWSGPGVLLTIFGWLLLAKGAISLLIPQIGLRAMAMSRRGPTGFVVGGGILICIALSSAAAQIWR